MNKPGVSPAGPSPSASGFVALQRALQKRRLSRYGLVLFLTALSLAALFEAGLFALPKLRAGLDHVFKILVREGWPPSFADAAGGLGQASWARLVLETALMATGGTAIAVFLSLFLSLLAARNTTPHPIVFHGTRVFLNLLRAIPELILGILFVAAFGFGMLPGVLALALHSLGMTSKFFAEVIEHADPGPIEAVVATGAQPLQVISHAILPQVLPRLADIAIYRFEYNFRAAAVLAIFGCGGIGIELHTALSLFDYQKATAVLLVIVFVVTLIDAIGQWLRRLLR